MTYEFFEDITVVWFCVSAVIICALLINEILKSNVKKMNQERQHRILWNQYEKQALEKHKANKK